MSQIVVAIDFSDCSINAFLHALSIAQKCALDLMLVWVKKAPEAKDKFERSEDSSKEVVSQFEALIGKYQPDLPGHTIKYKIRTGKVYREIAAEAKQNNTMMIVVGTHGASGFEEFWIGSNANKIVAASPCPVITIRGGVDIKRPLSRIVLPIDSTLETRQKATFTGYLAKKHDAIVHILALYTTKVKAIRQNVDLYAKQVALHFDEEGVKYQFAGIEADNISDAMIEYARKIDANLISIMTEQESSTSNLWMGPYAHQTVNHSPMPVLSIKPKQVLATGLGF